MKKRMRTPEAVAISPAELALPLAGFDASSVSTTSPLAEEVAALFLELRNPLHRYLLTFGLATEDCEEVAQEVFLSLFRHLRRDGARTNLRGWVFRVGHNLALKRRLADSRDISLGTDYSEQGYLVADHAPDPETEAADRQTQQRLHAVWRALPEQDRRCMALRAEGLRYREIAGVLEISLGAVALSLARSLDRMAQVARRHG